MIKGKENKPCFDSITFKKLKFISKLKLIFRNKIQSLQTHQFLIELIETIKPRRLLLITFVPKRQNIKFI